MLQSDIKVQNSPSVGEVIIAVDVEDLAELRAAGPDVVLEAGRDVASEVQLGDEGLTSAAWRHHLNIQHRLSEITEIPKESLWWLLSALPTL